MTIMNDEHVQIIIDNESSNKDSWLVKTVYIPEMVGDTDWCFDYSS